MWAETFRSQVLRALAKRWSTVGRSARASGVPLAPVQYGTELPRYEEGCANEHAGPGRFITSRRSERAPTSLCSFRAIMRSNRRKRLASLASHHFQMATPVLTRLMAFCTVRTAKLHLLQRQRTRKANRKANLLNAFLP
jgi:hypothetical protein